MRCFYCVGVASRHRAWLRSNSATIALLCFVLCCLLCCLPSSLMAAENPEDADLSSEHLDFFEKQVRPLLIKQCFECHGGTKAAGGLSLASAKGWQKGGESGPAIVPNDPEKSLLIEAVNYRSLEMPPADKGGKLSEEEIAILTKWVAMGAPDPRDGSDVPGGMSRDEAKAWWAFPLRPSPTSEHSFVERPAT